MRAIEGLRCGCCAIAGGLGVYATSHTVCLFNGVSQQGIHDITKIWQRCRSSLFYGPARHEIPRFAFAWMVIGAICGPPLLKGCLCAKKEPEAPCRGRPRYRQYYS